jgi:hypothetical protein
MIGGKYFEIDWRNFVQGMTSSEYTDDGGFSPGSATGIKSTNINPTHTPGLLQFPALSDDKSTNLSGEIIASTYCPVTTYETGFVTDTGKFYGWNGTTLSTAIATDSTRAYTAGKTDMAPYGPYIYGTSATYIWEWIVTTATINQTYLAFASSSGGASWTPANCPHPVLVYEGNIYYGNGPQLLRQTTVGGTPTEVLLIPNYNEIIVALAIDPGTGKMLISTEGFTNISNATERLSKVQYYNGFSNKVDKVVITDEMVTSFHPVGGTVYIGYGQNFGYWTGTGPQFLRKLNISLDNTTLLYKHHITNIGNIIYMIEAHKILAYGEVMLGQGRSFWYANQNFVGATPTSMSCITNIGSGELAYAFPTAKFSTIDTTTVADISSASNFLTKKYRFPREVTFNGIIVEYSTDVTTSTNIGTWNIIDDTGTQHTLEQINTSETKRIFEITNPTINTRSIQLLYSPDRNEAVERITVFYNDKP